MVKRTAHRHSKFRDSRIVMLFTMSVAVNACTHVSRVESAPTGSPPPYLLGSFIDDYGGRHTISASEWKQGDDDYRIVRWNSDARYLIAENSSEGPASLGRWTRIDWVRLQGMPQYTWAFCFSAFQMKTAAAAESSVVAKSDVPRSGCNGYPFTRMRVGP